MLEKIWTDWEAFAQYAFNKSHSTCYAFVAFQTAYLKAHYPAEYMAAVLNNNMNNIDKITFFMDECKRMGIEVLGPDINESQALYAVNSKGEIRVGLVALKGIGEAAVSAIIEERSANGPFTDIFNLVERANLRTVNKKALETLAQAGAFDSIGEYHRAQYVQPDNENQSGIEKAIRYGNTFQESKNSAQVSLFGEASEIHISKPMLAPCESWSNIEQLKREKDITGIYISGHPLDDYKIDIESFCNGSIKKLTEHENKMQLLDKEFTLAGIITAAQHRVNKSGKPFGSFTIEDFEASMSDIMLFSEDYMRFKHLLVADTFVCMRCSYQKRWGREDELSLKVLSMSHLDEIRKKSKKLTVHLTLERINDAAIGEFEKLIRGNAGTCTLNIKIWDPQSSYDVQMQSSFKVDPNNELIERLKGLSDELTLS